MNNYTYTITVQCSDASEYGAVAEGLDRLIGAAISTPGVIQDLGISQVGQLDGQLQEILLRPDTDCANYILIEVYKHMGLDTPLFLQYAHT